jgi:hypothetical protein
MKKRTHSTKDSAPLERPQSKVAKKARDKPKIAWNNRKKKRKLS